MDEIKLKPCPFCGGSASVIKTICQSNGAVCYHIHMDLEDETNDD